MSAPDKNELLRLGQIMKEFNDAAKPLIENNADAQLRMQLAMTQERQEEIGRLAQEMMRSLMIVAMQGGHDDAVADFVVKSVAFVNQVIEVAQEAGVTAFDEAFPAHHKTEENAQAFEKLGAKNIARMCRP